MGKLTGIALKRAQLVPSAVFTSPDAVVRSEALSLAQKIAILRRWEFDMRRSPASASTAIDGESKLLSEVRGALAAALDTATASGLATPVKPTMPARH